MLVRHIKVDMFGRTTLLGIPFSGSLVPCFAVGGEVLDQLTPQRQKLPPAKPGQPEGTILSFACFNSPGPGARPKTFTHARPITMPKFAVVTLLPKLSP